MLSISALSPVRLIIRYFLSPSLKSSRTIEVLPYPDNFFDKIVSNCSLEHFNDDTKALNEMSRVLKPGGIVVLTVDSLSYPGTKDELRKLHAKIAYVVNYYTFYHIMQEFNERGNGSSFFKMKYLIWYG
jgi:ubiquinone/menaquinone biosynthesis C-methylase UbiE